jgi:hypothetical protein
VCCAGRSLCDGLISRSEGSFRVCVCVCVYVCVGGCVCVCVCVGGCVWVRNIKMTRLRSTLDWIVTEKIYPYSELRFLEYINHLPKQCNLQAQGDNLVSSTNRPYQYLISLLLYQTLNFSWGWGFLHSLLFREPLRNHHSD